MSRCNTCTNCTNSDYTIDSLCNKSYRNLQLDTNNKVITNLVRIPSSLYTNNLESVVVSHNLFTNLQSDYMGNPAGSQSSDRARFSGSKLIFNRTVPSRGNSTKRSKTSMRPGSQAPGGVGVDVKHNSYQRYLLKKKGLSALQGSKNKSLGINDKRIQNNKFRKGEVIAGCNCLAPSFPIQQSKLVIDNYALTH